jgi:DNA-binding transcriptional MerR regulator
MSPSNPDDARYTLTDLADLAGVTPRTVRYYLSQGLLPAVGVAGPGAKYDDSHLARLTLIKRLQRDHLPLAEIRRRLESLDDAAVLAIVETAPEPPADSALDYIRRVTTPPPAAPSTAPLMPLRGRIVADAPALYARSMPSSAPPADSPPDLPTRAQRSQWERLELAPDIELHIRRPLTRSTSKRVDRLIEIARDLLEEE